MSKERLEEMLEFYNHHSNDEDLMDMIGILRDRFLKHEVINRKHGYDILSELVCGPEHVIFYTAEYIDILEQQNKRYRETLEFYSDRENYNPNILCPTGEVYMSVIDYDEGEEARKALESESE